MEFTSLEMCAGAGGQAFGLERAGFAHEGLIEIDKYACSTAEVIEASEQGEAVRIQTTTVKKAGTMRSHLNSKARKEKRTLGLKRVGTDIYVWLTMS